MLQTVKKVRLPLTTGKADDSGPPSYLRYLETCLQTTMGHPVFLGSYWELGMECDLRLKGLWDGCARMQGKLCISLTRSPGA